MTLQALELRSFLNKDNDDDDDDDDDDDNDDDDDDLTPSR